ncbi:anthranilate phosphoribosyltransferase 1 [Paraoerskovia sediminicola]|uniref:Anthranilate phosphoribosyltransferase n=1 Tax=Paraoerskovia sediminicola TaxID=1138587 RepID=A0ABM8G5H1_9CELL|nr:anthranilate phosphoribosyltransferase [Paraoerskovia sediminicola]BDZ43327.1 anthranilate phosphoribosyltransferase 1 [Paraoerskovia sediminicola]
MPETPARPAVDTVPPTWPSLLSGLVRGEDLSRADAAWAMGEVMAGAVPPARLAGFLVALRCKGETVDELTGLADTMLANARRFVVDGPSVDIVGTGGDLAHTVNISTMAAVVVAGTGLRVVKHGNRAASSSSGSADVLEELGIRLDHTPERVREIALEAGITFCFAAVFHPSMRHAGAARKDLGVPTAFNLLGPLTNPAQPAAVAVGCADAQAAPLMAGVFAARGTSALVFRGDDGLDELAATGSTTLWEVRDGTVVVHRIDPAVDLGLARITVQDLRGGSAQENATVARDLLAGATGAVRETVLLNAAAAIVADASLPGTGEGPLVDRLRAGMQHAAQSVDSGSAASVMEAWAKASAVA